MNLPTKLEEADVALGEKIAGKREKPAVKAAGKAGQIGDQEPLYAISAAVWIWGLCAKDRRLSETGVMLFAAVAGADLGKSVIKRLVKRTRPHVWMDEGRYEREAEGSPEKPEQSIPSGHTACTVAFARALSRSYPRAGVACELASGALGWSRVAKGAHWPLDVVAGMVVGLITEAVTSGILRGTDLLAAAGRGFAKKKPRDLWSKWRRSR